MMDGERFRTQPELKRILHRSDSQREFFNICASNCYYFVHNSVPIEMCA